MKLDEHSVVKPRRAWSTPPDRPVCAAFGRASELAVPDHGAGMAREWTASKTASRRPALTRFRARGTLLYATPRPRAGRMLPNELRAEKVVHLGEALPLGVRDARFERSVKMAWMLRAVLEGKN